MGNLLNAELIYYILYSISGKGRSSGGTSENALSAAQLVNPFNTAIQTVR